MGDIVSLVEKAAQDLGEENLKKAEENLKKVNSLWKIIYLN